MAAENENQTVSDEAAPIARAPAALSTATASSVSTKWSLRLLIIGVVFVAFGLWGLYDAQVAYPDRGRKAAEFHEFQYLQQTALDRPPLSNEAGIKDPKTRLAQLRAQQKESGKLRETEIALFQWLGQLQMVEDLEPSKTEFPRTTGPEGQSEGAQERLSALRKKWTTDDGSEKKTTAALAPYDIPSQYLILAAGVGIGGWMLFQIVAAKTKVYRFDYEKQQLTLPDGGVLAPSDIEEIDKRSWHKYFVTMKVKPSHPQLGGKEVKIDLLRYEPVEQWVLAMERTAFPEQDGAVSPGPSEPAATPTSTPA